MEFASFKLFSVTYLELYLARKERGRPKTTWRKTAEKERNKAGWKSWSATKAAAQNRQCWAESMTALCTYWRDEKI